MGKPPLASARAILASIQVMGAMLIAPLASAFNDVLLPLGSNLQEIVDAHAPGTRYVLASGVHRAQRIVPKDGDVITGEPGAVLNGCLLLENWEREGDWWVHPVPVLVPLVAPEGIACADELCLQTQDLYIDGVRLTAVSAREFVAGPLTWHLDRDQGKVFLAIDPSGLPVELGGGAPSAIDCAPPGLPAVQGVVIEDLTIDKYPTPPQVGAVRLGGGGTIRRCIVTSCHAYGVQLMSSAATVENCYLGDHGMSGVAGTGIGAVIQNCEIAYNVWPMYGGLAWDNGGSKFAGSRDTVFRGNYIHHNYGPGLWTDIKTTLHTIEDNIIEFNSWEGILIELSNQVVIRRNICRWNGVNHRGGFWGGQICIQNSSASEIHSNYIETGPDNNSPWGARQGIIAINQTERAWDEVYYGGSFGVRELLIRDNLLLMPSGGQSGIDYGILGWETYGDFLAAGLQWRNNKYLTGQPLDNRWSWRRLPNWNAYGAQSLEWRDWSVDQDTGSSFESIRHGQFPPTGLAQLPLITATTGNDYQALKLAATTVRPAVSTVDRDGDSLRDQWERQYSSSLALLSGDGDNDGDGLSNAEEMSLGLDPLRPDTDNDGLSDSWEKTSGSDPLVHDSGVDSDGDGRSKLEEWMDGTDPSTPELADQPIDETAVSLWLSPSAGLITDPDGAVTRWQEQGPHQILAGWFGVPKILGAGPTGIPRVDPDVSLDLPGRESLWGTASSGSTLTFVYQPDEIDLSQQWRAVLTNEEYLNQGFRLFLKAGYLVLSSYQSGGNLSMAGSTQLKSGQSYIISVSVEPDGRGGSLYLDGRLEASATSGSVVPSGAPLMLGNIGGVLSQPALFSEVVVFNRRLTHRERQSLEGFLLQKYVTGIPQGPDGDRDGMPTAWELAHGLDPLTPNALSDSDADGAPNVVELQRELDPNHPDTDSDGLPDGWEVVGGTNPLVDDRLADPDGDGLSNQDEFANSTNPLIPDGDPSFLSFNRIRLWWRGNAGIEATEEGISRWLDSSPNGNAGQPGQPDASLPQAVIHWRGRRVVRLSELALVSSQPVDPSTRLHLPGATITAVIRPVAPSAAAGFQRLFAFGDALVGVDAGRFVLRNASGSVNVRSTTAVPSGEFFLTCQTGPPDSPSRLLVNGLPAIETVGLDAAVPAVLSFGGAGVWPVDLAEVVVHAGVLPPLDRRFAEDVLQAKWLGTGPLAVDTDADSLPDWWEHEACTDVATADADADADWDGITNAVAFSTGSPGFEWKDADSDSMHDGWEQGHGLNPALPDHLEDEDLDGIPNGLEHALLAPPHLVGQDEFWGIAWLQDDAQSFILLKHQANQRSWALRPRWETAAALEPESWSWLPANAETTASSATTTMEEILIPRDPENGPSRAFFRLRLVNE